MDIFPKNTWIVVAIAWVLLGLAFTCSDEDITLLHGLCFVFMQVLQLGANLNAEAKSTKLLFINISFFAYLIFTYYTCDLTARMTSGPPGNPIKSLNDVLNLGYQVLCGREVKCPI